MNVLTMLPSYLGVTIVAGFAFLGSAAVFILGKAVFSADGKPAKRLARLIRAVRGK